MIYREHLIEIWVNGKKLELESQKSLNLRFQNVLFSPEKISSTQAEYSFEFEIPSTPHNDKIFDYANNLSKLNKFHSRWEAEVYADGIMIFNGSMTLNSYKNKSYKVNLVSVKSYSLEDIFGDSVLYDISGKKSDQRWYIDFDGFSTINQYNSGNTFVTFPLVSYGAFQKSKKTNSDGSTTYTSKYDLDNYNRWKVEDFYPSLSVLETLKKCFEYKGYTVAGDAFQDNYLSNIFMSTNLADGQDPEYNVGNPKFGSLNLECSWRSSDESYLIQSLNYPYLRTSKFNDKTIGLDFVNEIEYNFSDVNLYDIFEGNISVEGGQSYMWEPNDRCIVIPADGYYKIEMNIDMRLDTSSNLTAKQWLAVESDIDLELFDTALKLEEGDLTFAPDFRITTPLEIQLVKNYDGNDNIELIKGKNNFQCIDGYVDNSTTHGSYSNWRNFQTCFPHEKMGYLAKENTLFFGVRQITPTKADMLGDSYFETGNSSCGFIYKDDSLMVYDPIVNPNFIMGATSMGNKNGGGCVAVIKNGYSWSKLDSEKHSVMYNQDGYLNVNGYDGAYIYTDSDYNENTYIDAPQCSFTQTNNTMTAKIYALVNLKKNDTLRLFGVHRNYETTDGYDVLYNTSGTINLKITAATPDSEPSLKFKGYGYNSPIEFDDKLRLSNFLSKETKISDWVQGVADAFNLDVLQNGNTVTINVKKKAEIANGYAVSIDDRCNSDEAESSMINYPKSMSVRYKIDTDEWGAEKSVVEKYGEEKMDDANWTDFIDSGFTVINLNDDSYVTSTSDKNLNFSYTWYDSFNWKEVDIDGAVNPYNTIMLRLPVISKYEYMIDGYDYEEAMKHDGYGLVQRFWFRPTNIPYMNGDIGEYCHVWSETYQKEKVYLYIPSNVSSDGYLNLSYKLSERSLLQKYFNINAYLSSNYVEVEVYLSPEEYMSIKNGSLVQFDKDLYYAVSIDGYDPSGYNSTTLKLMKKVV